MAAHVCWRSLKAAFKAHRVQKRYLAICEGRVRETGGGLKVPLRVGDRWRESRPLGFDPQSAVRLKMGVGDLESLTEFAVLALSPAVGVQGRALIEAGPHTGRQHQIRAHLAFSGLPLAGDKLYGPDERLFLKHLNEELTVEDYERLGHTRHALHAAELSCSLFGAHRTWRSTLPLELERLMAPLERT